MQNTISYSVTPIDIPAVNEIHHPGIFGNFGDVIDLKLEELAGKNSEHAKISTNFYRFLRDEVDIEEFTRIQKKYVTPEHIAVGKNDFKLGADHLKYIDPIHWFRGKMNSALRIKLNESSPMDILDIGTGCGHFPTIARFFGHNVLAVDMPLQPAVKDQDTHFYNEICKVYGVNKVDLKIEPFKDFKFDKKFDLVTAFMTAFNVMEDRTPYTIDAWKYFFKNLHTNVLKPDGYIFFSLTRGKVTDSVWEFLKSKSEWYDDKSMYLLIRDVESVYS